MFGHELCDPQIGDRLRSGSCLAMSPMGAAALSSSLKLLKRIGLIGLYPRLGVGVILVEYAVIPCVEDAVGPREAAGVNDPPKPRRREAVALLDRFSSSPARPRRLALRRIVRGSLGAGGGIQVDSSMMVGCQRSPLGLIEIDLVQMPLRRVEKEIRIHGRGLHGRYPSSFRGPISAAGMQTQSRRCPGSSDTNSC
jgi:hypothetical protein